MLHGQRAQLIDRGAALHGALHFICAGQQFVDAHAAFVAAVVAVRAALGFVEREVRRILDAELREEITAVDFHQLVELLLGGMMRILAFRTERADQALGHDAEERVGEVEGIDVHVQQTRDRLRRGVGVQRGEDKVAGERGLDADGRRLVIAHFADHDHVGIGAQEGAHGRGEGEVDLRLHLHLAQSFLRDFDRVFRGPDFHVLGVDRSERGMERGRFP